MKKLLKTVTISFLATFVLSMYFFKFDSIFFGATISSYLIFGATFVICSLLLNKGFSMISLKNENFEQNSFNHIPEHIYAFCKKFYTEEEAAVAAYINNSNLHPEVSSFLYRFLDKNTQIELNEYAQYAKNLNFKKRYEEKKNILFSISSVLLAILSGYIYDSNIKGLILLSVGFISYNLWQYKKFLDVSNDNLIIIDACNEISIDILQNRNPKYIFYKLQTLLLLDNQEAIEYMAQTLIISPREAKSITINQVTATTEMPDSKATKNNVVNTLERRKSQLFTIGQKKQNYQTN